MCGRYTVIAPAPALAKRFSAREAPTPPPNFNAAPSQALPIITNAAPGQIQLVSWGLVPSWSRDPVSGPKPINARAETLAEKPSCWRGGAAWCWPTRSTSGRPPSGARFRTASC